MTAVMHGVRVLEVAEHTFVPAASALLSDWGAEVIKIEHITRGDAMRGLARSGTLNLGDSGVHVLMEHSNRGKQSLALDLSQPAGLEILYRLAEVSDVFLTNKLPRVRAALHIDVADIQARNPKIVYVRGSGYGSAGPDADRGGYDSLAYWARSGVAATATPPDLDRLIWQPGPAYGDSLGAMTIAGGISAALLHRERTGEATTVDVSLLATGMWALGGGIALAMHTGEPWKQAADLRKRIANPLTNSYRTSDGRWIFLSCLQGFEYWPDLCRVLGRPDLARDPRFDSVEALAAHSSEAIAILEEHFGSASLHEWRQRLADFRGQWAPVQEPLEVPSDPQVIANGYLQQAVTKDGRPFHLVASPVQFGGQPSPPGRAPDFNEHGDGILTGLLGMEWDDVIQLKVDGVVG